MIQGNTIYFLRQQYEANSLGILSSFVFDFINCKSHYRVDCRVYTVDVEIKTHYFRYIL